MLFPTIRFALFFSAVFILYWYVFRLKKQRTILLVCASYVFYASWDWRFCLLLFIVSCLAGFFGGLIGREKDYIPRKILLVLALLVHISILAFFKYFYSASSYIYYTFYSDYTLPLFLRTLQEKSLLFPIGISYYTFRALSYIFDIYLCKMRPVKSFADVLLYISFFPQLASGPIMQAAPFLHALPENLQRDADPYSRPIEFDRSTVLILSGLYKKMLLANFLSVLAVNPVFAAPLHCNTAELLTALIAYTFVIYCDFSGYSDMAIGIGLLLGFDTPKNFNRPYMSQSVSEFWRRWHISFSSWLRDYVYFSFGGSRFGLFRTVCALMLTMIIAGIWHGGSFTFLLWGALQGSACVIERIGAAGMRSYKKRHTGFSHPSPALQTEFADTQKTCFQKLFGFGFSWQKILRTALVFVFLNISWLIFRTESLEEIMIFFQALKNIHLPFNTVHPLTFPLLLSAFLLQLPSEQLREKAFAFYLRCPFFVKTAGAALFFIGINSIAMSGMAPYIYFGF